MLLITDVFFLMKNNNLDLKLLFNNDKLIVLTLALFLYLRHSRNKKARAWIDCF